MNRSELRAGGATLVAKSAENLQSKTHFSYEECKALLVMFERMVPSGKMDRTILREFMSGCFDITSDVMLDFIFRAFDNDYKGIDETKFIVGLSCILRGSAEEQIAYCYNCFDINGDGSLAHAELHHCLRGCIVPGYGIDMEEIEDAEKEIVDICMRKLDVDGDGQVTKEDFTSAAMANPLLMQSVGPCLPDPNAMAAFLAMFTENYRSYSSEWEPAGGQLVPTLSRISETMGSIFKLDEAGRLHKRKSKAERALIPEGLEGMGSA